jgi:hypothetical protein
VALPFEAGRRNVKGEKDLYHMMMMVLALPFAEWNFQFSQPPLIMAFWGIFSASEFCC